MSETRSARMAVTVVFVAHAAPFASWTAHIPQVKRRLGMTDARLGLALLGAPVGAVVAMLVTPWLLARLGSRRMIQAGLTGYCIAGLGVGLATSQRQLFASLAVWGLFHGSLDVSMNTQGITVQRAAGRPIMSGLHGAWSIGTFAGAALGALGVATGLALTHQLLILGVAAAASAGWASRWLLADPPHYPSQRAPKPLAVLRHPVILALGGVALACMLCEGAAADWSAVYLRDSLAANATLAGLGYATFSATMVTFRLGGDRLLRRLRARRLLPALATVAAVGMAAALLVGRPAAALIGFACLGMGVALIIPSAFSAAGRLADVRPGTGVAAVSALGWIGYVGGPPLIGRMAGRFSLPAALSLVPLLCVAIAVATRASTAFDRPAVSVDR